MSKASRRWKAGGIAGPLGIACVRRSMTLKEYRKERRRRDRDNAWAVWVAQSVCSEIFPDDWREGRRRLFKEYRQ